LHAGDAGRSRRRHAWRSDDARLAAHDSDTGGEDTRSPRLDAKTVDQPPGSGPPKKGLTSEPAGGASTQPLCTARCSVSVSSRAVTCSYRARVTPRWIFPLVVRPTVPLGTNATSST